MVQNPVYACVLHAAANASAKQTADVKPYTDSHPVADSGSDSGSDDFPEPTAVCKSYAIADALSEPATFCKSNSVAYAFTYTLADAFAEPAAICEPN
jgi:hypothetical protein